MAENENHDSLDVGRIQSDNLETSAHSQAPATDMPSEDVDSVDVGEDKKHSIKTDPDEELPNVTPPPRIPLKPQRQVKLDLSHRKDPFQPKTPVHRFSGKRVALRIFSFGLIMAAIFLILKFPVLTTTLTYKEPPQIVDTAKPQLPSPEIVPAGNKILIPKIEVDAPIVEEPSRNEAAVLRALRDGVVHYGATASPGQNGNVVMIGHSSNDWWEPGNYKFVFVLLDKLVIGDRIEVNYNERKYVYEVSEILIVDPSAVEVLNPTTDPVLTLITCTPPGTSWRRLIVKSKQINPAPVRQEIAATDLGTTPQVLPSNPETFLDNVSGVFVDAFYAVKSWLNPQEKYEENNKPRGRLPQVSWQGLSTSLLGSAL